MWDFSSPRKVIFGEDALNYLTFRKFKHAFIVTDPTMRKFHLEKIEPLLKENDTEITVFDDITGEPTLEKARKGAKLLSQTSPDVLIGLGGGSVLDTAKAMWALWADPSTDIESLDPIGDLNLREKTKAILINIPTTSGTGSDVTWAVVLTDTSSEPPRKASMGNRELVADITILDAVLTKTMPPHLIAGTGMDALCHAVEGYLSQWRNDFSDALTKHAFLLVWKNLPVAFNLAKKEEPNFELSQTLHNAATMAGWGFSNSQIILGHSISHSVGAIFKIPHSVIIGPACWYALMYNRDVAKERIADLAKLVGLIGDSEEDLTTKLIDSLKELLINLELHLSLKDMNVSRSSFENNLKALVDYAINDSGTLSNPRSVDYEDFERIFECVYNGSPIEF